MAATLLASGCGLTEYENKMDYARSRMAFLEEQNRYLGPPLYWPDSVKMPPGTKPVEIPTQSEIFIRPPLGIAQMGQAIVPQYFPPLFRFGPARTADGTQGGSTSPFQEMFFGASSLEQPEAFRKRVLGILNAPPQGKWTPRRVRRGPGRPELDLEGYTPYEDRTKSRVYVYAFQAEQYAMAIVYRVAPKANEQDVLLRIEYSLGSVVVGGQAMRLHQGFPPPQ